MAVKRPHGFLSAVWRWVVTAAFVVCQSVATLGAAEPPVTVGATVGGSTQAAGDSDSPYLGPGVGGTTVGGVFFVDVGLSSAISLGGEVSLAGNISGSQDQRVPGGSNSLLSQHRDTVFAGVLKVRTPISNRLQVSISGGLGVALRESNRTGTFRPNTPPFVLTPVTERLSDTVLATTAGFDGVVAVSNRLGLLAVVRVHYLADNDRLPDGVVHRGVSSLILRYGFGAQVRF